MHISAALIWTPLPMVSSPGIDVSSSGQSFSLKMPVLQLLILRFSMFTLPPMLRMAFSQGLSALGPPMVPPLMVMFTPLRTYNRAFVFVRLKPFRSNVRSLSPSSALMSIKAPPRSALSSSLTVEPSAASSKAVFRERYGFTSSPLVTLTFWTLP